jgi:hypothetical protein
VAVTRARVRHQREKEHRRATGLQWAVSDRELESYLDQLVSITMDKQADAGAWWASLSRYAREPHDSGTYDRARVARCAQRLTEALFPSWPPQQQEDLTTGE